jgi:hypothetical protein
MGELTYYYNINAIERMIDMNRNLTEIIFLLDRSGSMGGLESDSIGGFNAFIENQRKLEGKTLVTGVLFDDQYEVVWNGAEAEKVKLTAEEYYVRGCTALLDAIGKTILDVGYRLSKTNEDNRPASREYTYKKVKELIKHQQEKYNWEFIFLGANIDAEKEADSLGINIENAYSFEASEVGVECMYKMVSEAVTEKRSV